MIKVGNAQLWVHDQDEALKFYTDKVGMQVRADVTMRRWVTSAGSRSGRPARTISQWC